MKHKHVSLVALVAVMAACAAVVGGTETDAHWDDLSTGTLTDNWTISDSNGHGDTQAWTLEDGTFTGTQDEPGNGGIIYSNETYGDFVLDLELNPDFGLDSGIFLRSTPSGRAYQIVVDNYDAGSIGGIYGEGLGGFYARYEEWQDIYRQGEWNHITAVVTGNPPTIDVWLNGQHVMAFQGEEELLDDEGHIALQVHAGDRYFEKTTRFRNVKVRPLD